MRRPTRHDPNASLVAAFIAANPDAVRRIPESAERPTNAQLARTGAERFFARQAVFNGRLRRGETYHGK